MTFMDVDTLISRVRDELMTPADLRLLRMTLSEIPSQQQLDEFLRSWDLEKEGAAKSLLMSYFMKSHPELAFPDYFGPRLKGLLNYYRFQNIKLISQYRKIVARLLEEGIRVTVFKGGAMKHLRPDLSRTMSDIDVLVDEADYSKAGAIITGMGYDLHWDMHSFDVHTTGSEEGILDVHKFIPMLTGRERLIMGEIMGRAKDSVIFGVQGRILSEEDLVFSLLVNLSRNIMNKTSSSGILFTFIDIKYLIDSKEGFDWRIVTENAQRSGAEKMLLFAVHFMNSVVPGLVPLDGTLPEHDMQEIATLVKYRRYLLCPLQEESHKLGIDTVIRNPRLIPAFLRVRPRYTFLKLFRGHPKAAGLILSWHETI